MVNTEPFENKSFYCSPIFKKNVFGTKNVTLPRLPQQMLKISVLQVASINLYPKLASNLECCVSHTAVQVGADMFGLERT